ncbi:MAG: hypothetical protein KJO21_07860 [Verrucomicrobiae bacterium]|nr:hypothetical protein [Verrucomicrobiae bacterium]NNJ43389.1 hypothetical protein [Akkermansiaceae bacterium]
MKAQHITLLTIAAAAFVSCAPSPMDGSQAEVPAPQIDGYHKIPMGKRTPDGKANRVISPYRPYNIIDVTGYRSGDIVGDPSTAQVDLATNKLILNTSKFLRIP